MKLVLPGSLLALCLGALPAAAQTDCPVTREDLMEALRASVAPAEGPKNGGLENNEWAAAVNRMGIVCAIAYSGEAPTDQWLGSRGIAAEKAETAVAFSLDGFALSTANLWAPAQPGGSLYSIVSSNPPSPEILHAGPPEAWGSPQDPMLGENLGGVIVFGGGLPLYSEGGLIGGLGVSGDTSCADHNVAWRIREKLGLGHVPKGVSPSGGDQILYDIRANGSSESGYGHVMCGGTEAEVAVEIGAGFIPEWKRAMK